MSSKLPEEIIEQIKVEAKSRSSWSNDEDSSPFKNGLYSGYVSGATEWAGWFVKHTALESEYIELGKRYNQAQ